MSRPAGSARNPAAASTTTAAPSRCRRASAVPVPAESGTALASLVWSHFLRRTAAHFAGKCSEREHAASENDCAAPTLWGGAVAFACSGRGRKLRRGLAPARQRRDAAEPLLDLLVGCHRELGALGVEQRCGDR